MRLKTIALLSLSLAMLSCGPNWNNPDEELTLIPEALEWIIDDPDELTFEMQGSDSTYYYINELHSGYHTRGSASSGDGMGYYVVSSQDYSQYFEINSKQMEYYINLECSDKGSNGNLLRITLLGTEWSYDFTYDRIHTVELETNNMHKHLWHDELTSVGSLLDSISINNVLCDSVYHFSLLDFEDQLEEESVTELYYAKHIGLVKFVRHNGVEVERMW